MPPDQAGDSHSWPWSRHDKLVVNPSRNKCLEPSTHGRIAQRSRLFGVCNSWINGEDAAINRTPVFPEYAKLFHGKESRFMKVFQTSRP
jgi:hypothetical protein